MFLLVTPLSQPEAQLALRGQIAAVAGGAEARDRLLRAGSPVEVRAVLGRAGQATRPPRRGAGPGPLA